MYLTVTTKTECRFRGAVGVMTSLFAGHWVPSSASGCLPESSSGEQAGGSWLWCGPPTGLVCDASCAAGFGSFGPFGSPGYVGCANRNAAGRPLTVTDLTVMSGPAALFAECRSKSRLKLVRHRMARSVSTTLLPGRNLFDLASYTR